MISKLFKTPTADDRAVAQLELAKVQFQQHKSQESYHKHMAAYYAEQILFYNSLLPTSKTGN